MSDDHPYRTSPYDEKMFHNHVYLLAFEANESWVNLFYYAVFESS